MAEEKARKSWYKRWWAIALWIFLGLSVLAALFGEETPTSQQASGNEGIVAKQPEIKTYAIGDEVVAGDFTWKITKVSTATEIGEYALGNFMGEKADGVFVILDVEVENTGKSAQYLTDSFIKLVDDQNREFSPNTVAAIYLKPQGSALVFEQINPGITKKGKIVFNVPPGLKVANVGISSNLLQSSLYNIKLAI